MSSFSSPRPLGIFNTPPPTIHWRTSVKAIYFKTTRRYITYRWRRKKRGESMISRNLQYRKMYRGSHRCDDERFTSSTDAIKRTTAKLSWNVDPVTLIWSRIPRTLRIRPMVKQQWNGQHTFSFIKIKWLQDGINIGRFSRQFFDLFKLFNIWCRLQSWKGIQIFTFYKRTHRWYRRKLCRSL